MNAAVGVPTGSSVREGHGRLEDRDRVVGEGPDGAAREARHVVPRLNPTSADERSQRCQRIRGIGGPDGKLGVVPIHGDRALLDARLAVADLEQLPWPDAEERVPAQALPALDRLEEVRRRRPVIEPEECADGRLEVGGARRPQEQRVGIASEPLRLGEAERVRRGHVRRLRLSCSSSRSARESKRPLVPGTKGRAFRGATLIRRCRTFLTDGSVSRPTDRRCPLSLALCAGAYLARGSRRTAPLKTGAHRSVRRLPGPFAAAVAPVSTSHRVSLPTLDGYSSRS